ncbi:MAG: arsenate reductase ArsC [Gemmatales bacterium]|nr:arsenate reductase ArsC [Gemmatales bacterium]MDW8176724.1 arsenate reductase ArsC [Gemmatales bacterium]
MRPRYISAVVLLVLGLAASFTLWRERFSGREPEQPQATQMPSSKTRVLILCTGNSCRSIMAEAIWRHLAADRFEVHSAGTQPKGIHPLTLRVLAERGISTEGLRSKGLEEVDTSAIDLLVTVCDSARDTCPHLPGQFQRLHWPFDDPPAFPGSEEEKLAVFRRVRDEIWEKIASYLHKPPSSGAR